MPTDIQWLEAARRYMQFHPCESTAVHPGHGHMLQMLVARTEREFADRQKAIFGSDDEGTAFADPQA